MIILVSAFTTYHLSLPLLLRVLQAHQQNGMLLAVIPAETITFSGEKSDIIAGSARAELVVVKGMVTSCFIRDLHTGYLVLAGHLAFAVLARYEQLSWIVQPESYSSSTPPQHHADMQPGPHQPDERWSQRLAPRLRQPLGADAVETFSHRDRQLLLLVNGARHVPDFCRLLHCSPEQVCSTLDAFEKEGWIR